MSYFIWKYFYLKGKSPLVDYYVFNSDSTGIKKKLKPNFNKTFSSSLDEINFQIIKINGLIYLNYISETNNWKEMIKKLTTKELIISNNKFEYHSVTFNKSNLGSSICKFPSIRFDSVTGSKIIAYHDEKFNYALQRKIIKKLGLTPN